MRESSLRGALSEFALEEILGLLQATAKTGLLEVRGPRGRGTLELTAGQLTAARFGDDHGPVALGAIFGIGIGDFAFRVAEVGTPDLEGALEDLIALGRAEDQRIAATRAVVRDDGTCYALSARAAERGSFAVTGDQWRVLLSLDGRRDVAAIAAHSGHGRLATLRVIGELLQNGLVDPVAAPTEGDAETGHAELAHEQAPLHRSRRRRPSPPDTHPASEVTEPAISDSSPWAEPRRVAERDLRGDQAQDADALRSMALAPQPAQADATTAATTEGAEDTATDARLAALAVLPPSTDVPAAQTAWVIPDLAIAGGDAEEASPAPVPRGGPEPTELETRASTVVESAEQPSPTADAGDTATPYTSAALPTPSTGARLRGFLASLRALVPQGSGAPTAPPEPTALAAPARGERAHGPPPRVVPADLARLANALIAEYGSSRYGAWPDEDIRARLRRIYQVNPLGMPLPVAGSALDAQALEAPNIDPGRVLPYLAMLIQQLREDAERSFGGEPTERGLLAALAEVHGEDRDLARAAEDILARSAALTHGRLTLVGGEERRSWELTRRECVIGRGSMGCDIRLDSDLVAEHHAKLSPYLDGFLLRDLGSESGTTVDGIPLAPHLDEQLLCGGETIEIGGISLLYERVPDRSAATT